MFFGLIQFIGFLSLIGLAGIQFFVIYLISKFESQNQNPLESSASLSKTTMPTIILFGISIFWLLINIYNFWFVFILQISAAIFFYFHLNDKKHWFEPRYLFRDLNDIKLRHGTLCIASSFSVIISFLLFIFIRK